LASLAKEFYSVANSGTVTDGYEAYFLESVHVELKDDITTDIVIPKSLYILSALVVGEPAGDVSVVPLGDEFGIGRTRWWIEDAGRGRRGRTSDPIHTSCGCCCRWWRWYGGSISARAGADGVPAIGGRRDEILLLLLVSEGDRAGRGGSGRR